MIRIAVALLGLVRRPYRRLFAPRTMGVRTIVADPAGRVLLVRHAYGPAAWHLPGGGVHRREKLSAAALRELQEETGLVVDAEPDEALRLHGVHSNFAEGKSDHIAVFVVRTPMVGEPAASSREIAEVGWFDPRELPATTARGTKRRILEWAEDRTPTFDW